MQVLCGADEKRADHHVDYRPRISQADAQPWLAGTLQAPTPSSEPLQFSDAMCAKSVTEPAPLMGSQQSQFDPFMPRSSAAPAPAQPHADLQDAMLTGMDAVPSDPQLHAEFVHGPGQIPQPHDPSSALDMLQQGERFVENASATGIISDPAEVARNFMQPRTAPAHTHTHDPSCITRMMCSQASQLCMGVQQW